MVSVYVAGKYSNINEVRSVYKQLIDLGFHISYDWTISATDNNNYLDKMTNDANNDFDGVYNADYSIILLTDNDYVYRGTFFELGVSLARDRQRNKCNTIVVLNPNSYANTCCFSHHSDIIKCNSITEAINLIK